jgi:hypothetical protein
MNQKWKQSDFVLVFQTESIDIRSNVTVDVNLAINRNWKQELFWHRLFSKWRAKRNSKFGFHSLVQCLLEVWTCGGANSRHASLSICSAVIWESESEEPWLRLVRLFCGSQSCLLQERDGSAFPTFVLIVGGSIFLLLYFIALYCLTYLIRWNEVGHESGKGQSRV